MSLSRYLAQRSRATLLVLGLCLLANDAWTFPTAFTYQGKLSQSGNPASGGFDMQFSLYDSPTVGLGSLNGSVIAVPGVAVNAGIFTVALDFGNAFNVDLYLQIDVRPTGSPNAYTTLSPRQTITSAPYALQTIQTVNAQFLDGVPGSRYIAADTSGNVGIGVGSNANVRLLVDHGVGDVGVYSTATTVYGVFGGATTGSGVYGYSDFGLGIRGISSTGTGVRGESSGSGYGVHAKNLGSGPALNVEGDAAQDIAHGGLVKAMLHVSGAGTIISCFNPRSQAASCGYQVARDAGTGYYRITLDFVPAGRFITGVAVLGDPAICFAPSFNAKFDAGAVVVLTSCNSGLLTDANFFLSVY